MKIVLTQEDLIQLIKYALVNKCFINSTHKVDVKFSSYDKDEFAKVTVLNEKETQTKEEPTEPPVSTSADDVPIDLSDIPF